MCGSWHRIVTEVGRYSASALIGATLLVVASLLTVLGSTLLVIEGVFLGFVVSLSATVLSSIGVYDTVHGDRKGLGIAFWTLLLSLVVLAYGGAVTVPWVLHTLFP